ncbi:hypothetical protein KKC88_01515 [Patescibacteria group bacterium]|nr:hypothetical protein [Patescibacteria group bacterium]MBU1673188.1 hypothetical protein [Patescibacteria group bacterium]MBU1963032.1 hypothetical protein [Patescibacteria group bacterium]
MTKWIIGTILIILGIVLVIKSEWFMGIFGRIAWAEEKLGAEGGTRLFYKLLGIGLIIFALLWISGIFYNFLDAIFIRD